MRAYIIFLATLVLAFPLVAQGQTYISGNIWTQTWTAAGSPYIIIGDTWALYLYILPGVVVQFDSDYELTVEYHLQVNGTPYNPVRFLYNNTSSMINLSPIYHSSFAQYHQINHAVFEGGSSYIYMLKGKYGDVSLQNCTFRDNSGPYGLLSFFGQSGATWKMTLSIVNCDFYNNELSDRAIIARNHDQLVMKNCRIYDNSADRIIDIAGEYSTIYRCEIFNNISDVGINLENGTIAFSILYETTSPGMPVFSRPSIPESPCDVQNCIVWGCDSISTYPEWTRIQYCDLETPFPGEGNISQDPMFVNPEAGDFRLLPNSPCINAGNPGGFWYDNDGTRADMGKDGGSGFIPFPTEIEFPEMAIGEQREDKFYFCNLNSFDVSIDSTYFTSPENFSFLLDPASVLLSWNEKALYTITYTHPGGERSTDMVIVSPQFIANDTASVHIRGTDIEFTPVSGTWTIENSPYYFYGSLIVEDGEQLIIEPGVVIYMCQPHVLKIEGNLLAIGEEDNKIRFYNNLGGDGRWGGLIFDEADNENIMEYTIVYWAVGNPITGGYGGDIYAKNSSLILNHLEVYCYGNSVLDIPVVYGGGLYAENCPTIVIRNSLFEDCVVDSFGGAAYFKDCNNVTIDSSTFNECVTYWQAGSIYFDNSTVSIDSCLFYHSEIKYSNDDGIALYLDSSTVDITRTVFNKSKTYMYDVATVALNNASTLTLDHTDICFNIAYDSRAINILDTGSEVHISNSIFHDVDELFWPYGTPNIVMNYSIAPVSWPGTGNLIGDPLISPECYLTSSSPCIDAGDPAFPLDPDSTRTDMGAYYWDGSGPLSGAISGVWTAENSPYLIGGDVEIAVGDTLQMLPGTLVEFLDIYNLYIYGVLLIEGEEDDSVTIIGADPTFYDGVRFYWYSTQGQSHIQCCDFDQIQLNLGPTPITINKCTLFPGIMGGGSSGSVLTNSSCYYISGGTDWTVIGNELHHSYGGAYYVLAFSCPVSSAHGEFIKNDVSAYAYAGGEYGSAMAEGFSECSGLFAHNDVSASAYGEMSSSSYGFRECTGTIRHNTVTAGVTGISQCSADIFNNTVINSDYGITSNSPINPIKNCIVYGCNTGFSGPFEVQYSCVYECNTPFASGATAGIGTIQEDPLLINTWFLDPNSPCIDAGDPDPFYNDPDGTRDDMGANYFDQGAAYATITLTPYNPPIQIPASGGSFDYNIEIENTGVNQVIGDVWCDVTLPNGTVYGPLLGPVSVAFSGGFIGDRDRTQTVPATAPEGVYTYQGFLGLHPDVVWDMDTFTFEKLSTGDGVPIESWQNTGEPFEDWMTPLESEAIPENYALNQNYPNPFNPLTTISFALSDASYVKLQIFNVAGRLVESPLKGWREAGYHEVTFDASNLASGLYFYRIEAGDFTAVKKMVLIK